MGMGYAGGAIVAIFDEDMQKLCPKEFKALVDAVEDTEDGTMDSFFQTFNDAGGPEYGFFSDEEYEKIEDKFHKLQKAFTKKYPALEVIPFYHYEDNGDRYDAFFGGAWEVLGTQEKVPDAIKLEKKLKKTGALDLQTLVFFG